MNDPVPPPRLPEGAQSRAESFTTGTQGDDPQNAAGVSSIDANSARFNALALSFHWGLRAGRCA